MGCEKFKEFVKSELTGWKKREVIGLLAVFIFIIISAIIKKDTPIAVVSAICGIFYTTIAGKGKVSCYIFGLMGTGCYSYLSFKNGLYGNLALYMLYYLPMQAYGIYEWKKNMKPQSKEIVKTVMPLKKRFLILIITILASLVMIYVLKLLEDSSPVIDAITTVFSVVGMYLTVKRSFEQWVIWMVVNGLSVIMWLNIVWHGARTYSTFIMWVVYFLLSVYFYITWNKEIKQDRLAQQKIEVDAAQN